MKRTLVTLCAALALAGCGSTPGRFDNVLVMSITGDRAFVSSLYGPVGITAELRAEDARELKRLREQARDAEELARMAARAQMQAKP
jgi:hypothetical protein